ncbi:bifunctional methylenetetrahydrofolate dehydrogenase/methenyltetrahydrofolate cyclohydrolase FolD [Piscinibacterium candidicorallinum]|jgi:methylenetetrahydrofolate dehydrogenase (NADP+)/methenyltetrahydrofolate cyclohydrolase|uniref:Bifunctional protein FolD n=1 Tax=Piscinibacterium candidicorallinum TaxID=1793872 RepID=A0ABV7GY97_9BURK
MSTVRIIDGKAVAQTLRGQIAQRVAKLTAAGRTPGLTVVLVGDDPASQVYVRNKVKSCQEVGMRSDMITLPATSTQAEVEAVLKRLSADPAVDGILLQLPLPKGLDSHKAIECIDPAKDVDGLTMASAGALFDGMPSFIPCTPYGCMKLLESVGCDPKGKHAVVIGRSILVGKPVGMLLLAANATVTFCHSATSNLKEIVRQADIVIAAVGRPKMIGADMIKPGAVVIDVGINRTAEGKLVGDVDFDALLPVAGAITPVPGGVGPMTITMLLENTLHAVERRG